MGMVIPESHGILPIIKYRGTYRGTLPRLFYREDPRKKSTINRDGANKFFIYCTLRKWTDTHAHAKIKKTTTKREMNTHINTRAREDPELLHTHHRERQEQK